MATFEQPRKLRIDMLFRTLNISHPYNADSLKTIDGRIVSMDDR